MQKPTKEKITSEGSREDDRDVLRGRSNRFFARCIFTWIEPWVFLGNVAGNERRPRFASTAQSGRSMDASSLFKAWAWPWGLGVNL